LPRDDGAFVFTRLSEIAAAVGAPLGSRQCRANFIVLVTSYPVASLKTWAERVHYQHLFGEADPEKIKVFLKTQRAIRVWYNEQQASAENGSVLSPGSSSNGPEISGPGAMGVTTVRSFDANRLERNAVWTISSVIEVVDAGAMKGFNFEQMADYIAMAGLAEFNLDADFGTAPTILRVFLAPRENRPPSLTDWDKAYLKALYQVRPSSTMQTDLINRSMVRDISH
jgi:hypothetical protein